MNLEAHGQGGRLKAEGIQKRKCLRFPLPPVSLYLRLPLRSCCLTALFTFSTTTQSSEYFHQVSS